MLKQPQIFGIDQSPVLVTMIRDLLFLDHTDDIRCAQMAKAIVKNEMLLEGLLTLLRLGFSENRKTGGGGHFDPRVITLNR